MSEQIAAMKVQWCVPPINVLRTGCQPFPVTVFFLLASVSSTRQMRRSSRRRTYISLACNASSRSPTASRGILSPSTTPSRSKSTCEFNRARACTRPTRPYYAAHKRASPGRATNCACDAEPRLARASCGAPLPPYHEPLRLHRRALQTLALAVGCLALPTQRDTFLTALAKAALPPRFVCVTLPRLASWSHVRFGRRWRRWRRTTSARTQPAQFGVLTGAPLLRFS
jgi:hypothetical protein